uniref:Uncharacterized protein n=1 Tax=Anguilla anguilla TaxID=7936 RepID=A0A0E9QMM7_ANGAN
MLMVNTQMRKLIGKTDQKIKAKQKVCLSKKFPHLCTWPGKQAPLQRSQVYN